MKPEGKLFIVKTLRKFIKQDVNIGIKLYCCKPMQDFTTFIEDNQCKTSVDIYSTSDGLAFCVDNSRVGALLARGIFQEVDATFYFKFCPFCGAKVEYIEEINDET